MLQNSARSASDVQFSLPANRESYVHPREVTRVSGCRLIEQPFIAAYIYIRLKRWCVAQIDCYAESANCSLKE